MRDHEQLSSDALATILANRTVFLSFLTARVGSADRAAEILQDALVRGVEKGGQLRDDESAVAWFYRLLRNAIVDDRRRRGAAERALERFAAEIEVEGVGDERDELHGAVCACIGGLLTTLRPDYADAIRAVDLEGTVVRDFAEANGITPNNASVRLHRARQALEQRVRVTCGACAVHGCVDCTCREPTRSLT